MRELVVENQEVLMVPQNLKSSNIGKVISVKAGEFELELDYEPTGLLENAICEFYTQTPRGKLFFESYAKSITGKTLVIASPAKHKFLQRRQYTRVKFVENLDIICANKTFCITTMDISAGGMKFKSNKAIDLDKTYSIELNFSKTISITCEFSPIRIEKSENLYIISGQFLFQNSQDKMLLTQFCAKRSFEIKNK